MCTGERLQIMWSVAPFKNQNLTIRLLESRKDSNVKQYDVLFGVVQNCYNEMIIWYCFFWELGPNVMTIFFTHIFKKYLNEIYILPVLPVKHIVHLFLYYILYAYIIPYAYSTTICIFRIILSLWIKDFHGTYFIRHEIMLVTSAVCASDY